MIFEGIKVEQKEDSDLKERILNVIQKDLKLKIQPEDIDKAYHTGPAQDGKQNIIAKFMKDSTASQFTNPMEN